MAVKTREELIGKNIKCNKFLYDFYTEKIWNHEERIRKLENVIFNKFAKIQKYCKYKKFNVLRVFGSFSQNKDTEKAEFDEMLDFIMHQKQMFRNYKL